MERAVPSPAEPDSGQGDPLRSGEGIAEAGAEVSGQPAVSETADPRVREASEAAETADKIELEELPAVLDGVYRQLKDALDHPATD